MPHQGHHRARVAVVLCATACLLACSTFAAAAESLCDPSFQDCRKPLLDLIANEQTKIDVAFDMMEDSVIADALINRFKAHIPVRVIADARRNKVSPQNGVILQTLAAAGIPIRVRSVGASMHWKFMLFVGQDKLQFGAANFSDYYLIPVSAYTNYTDEAIYFTDDSALVDSFKTRMDDAWMDTTLLSNYANVHTPLAREYATFPISPDLLFVPWQNFAKRAVPRYDAETVRIDVIMYKITENSHADGMIRAAKRGVPVRLIVEPSWYRSTDNLWQAYEIDRMYAAGVQIRVRAHQGFTHQKTVLLYGQAMSIFGSSNWTSDSNKAQHEHNYFTTKSWMFTWFKNNFNRKWSNSKGYAETKAFTPLPPDKPVNVSPANVSGTQPVSGAYLTWKPGPWAWKADVYFGTSSNPPLLASNVSVTPNSTKKFALPALTPGRTYYWKIVSKTMANKTATGTIWSFGT
jgi:phosphatidylserine/phosphatidylglycerophosphate/cardiolipin synthase-like enzyme